MNKGNRRINLPITLLLLAVFGFISAGTAFAGWWHKTPEQKVEKVIKKITGELDLSAAQEEALRKGVAEVMAQTKDLMPKGAAFHDLLIEQLQNGKIDKVRVKQEMVQRREGFEIAMNLALDRADSFLQTLNPEQRQKLVDHLQKMKDRSHCQF